MAIKTPKQLLTLCLDTDLSGTCEAVLEDGADMIDPAFKDSFKRPLLTEFEAEALYYLALGLSNWAIARKCSLSLRGVESRLATLYEKLFVSMPEGTAHRHAG